MNALLRLFFVTCCLVIQPALAFAQGFSERSGSISLSNKTAEQIVRTYSISVNGQVYGGVFVAQDLLLGISKEFNLGSSQWSELEQALRRILRPPIKRPEQSEVAKAWQTQVVEQLSAEELREVERFVRTPAGEHFVEAMLLARSRIEFELWEQNGPLLEQDHREFVEKVQDILDRCRCKKEADSLLSNELKR